MNDVTVDKVWCILDDGPAAGHVCEMPNDNRTIVVTMGCGNEFLYRIYAVTPGSCIGRYRWRPPVAQ